MRPVLLASQSNSGSTWFSRCIAASPRVASFPKEFFNPVLNHKHTEPLSRVFGCELHSCVPNLARSRRADELAPVIWQTWDRESFNFTKENYAAFQLSGLTHWFDVAVLVRDVAYCFPPERARVRCWYDSWFWSLLHNGAIHPQATAWLFKHATTSHVRAVIAWHLVRWKLEAFCAAFHIQPVDYSEVGILARHPRELAEYLSERLPGQLDPRPIAKAAAASFKWPESAPRQHADEWRPALEAAREFSTLFRSLHPL